MFLNRSRWARPVFLIGRSQREAALCVVFELKTFFHRIDRDSSARHLRAKKKLKKQQFVTSSSLFATNRELNCNNRLIKYGGVASIRNAKKKELQMQLQPHGQHLELES
jgi:hypothetical protein